MKFHKNIPPPHHHSTTARDLQSRHYRGSNGITHQTPSRPAFPADPPFSTPDTANSCQSPPPTLQPLPKPPPAIALCVRDTKPLSPDVAAARFGLTV
ncbi:Uncharacterized protein HZ326_19065 [Fusarium oxysporum f. sp. albedinis]|nr:Uncharacterized protein HZ326_19065 [Fusarium oxysporum f. sp. albedinis]